MVDAMVSNTIVRENVWVQVPSPVPIFVNNINDLYL